MRDRSAIDTILGYFYQFDCSIEMLLALQNNSDTITVEGIEDIDINSASKETAIQCKYYSKTAYNHSVIAKPIRLMLSHYKEVKEGRKPKIKYKIYGHYKSGQSKLPSPITIDFLKTKFLSYRRDGINYEHHIVLGLSDNDLAEFLDLLDIDIKARTYDAQLNKIIKILQAEFSCDKFEADHFYYSNALQTIKDIAIKSNVSDRVISKGDFLNKINKKELLFDLWLLKLKGKEKHFRALRKKYFSSLNTSPFERFFLFEVPDSFKQNELKELLFTISRKWSKLTKRTTEPFCPYVYLHNLPKEKLIEIKVELQNEDFSFIDGYDFQGASFSHNSLVKQASHNNVIKIKILNELDYIDLVLSDISATKEVYQFFLSSPFYDNSSNELKHVKIQINELTDIKEII